jgi:iron complex transport system substrate-binding protein
MKKIFSLTLFLLLSLLLTGGCSLQKQAESNTAAMFTVTDSSGRHVQLRQPVKRAVVVNAYNAELINAIGALEQVVGVDYYIYQDQEGFRRRFNKDMLVGQSQGGLNYEKIIALKPDVVIMTGNSGWQEAEKKLRPFGIPVVTVDAYYTGQFASNVRLLGQIFGREGDASELAAYFTDWLRYRHAAAERAPPQRLF